MIAINENARLAGLAREILLKENRGDNNKPLVRKLHNQVVDWIAAVPVSNDLKVVLFALARMSDEYGRCYNATCWRITKQCGFSALGLLDTWLAIRKLKRLQIIAADTKNKFIRLRLQMPPETLIKGGGHAL